jgi:hypothetical protein
MRHDFPLEWNRLLDVNNGNDAILELRKEHFPLFANVDNIKSIGTKAFTLGIDHSLKEEGDNLGILKTDNMKVKVPKASVNGNHKDLFFFVKYEC